ncbi:MAG TPA: hypothetical protein VKY73_05955 [Polyangiaceae bacterium]|nr:hypothetical protein [Polyangiaceae bacterium]
MTGHPGLGVDEADRATTVQTLERARPLSRRLSGALFGAAASLGLALVFAPSELALRATLFAGFASALVLGGYAVARRVVARRRIPEPGRPAPGILRERTEEDGRVVLDMPADGLEPWGSDAWTLFVATGAVLAISLLLGTSAWALPVFLLGLIAALALRLRTAVEDVIRIEIEPGEWSVHAVEGGRVVHCHGRGLLLPELLPHALLLWSETGRIGTLRWELEPEERAWLAERLLAAAHACKSGPSERRHEVDEEEPDEHRQEEQGENER